jgi:SAM-dependent methyltransferase
MLSLARQNARHHGVEGRCDFILADYMTYAVNNSFDYSIVMGFMDYVEEPKKVIEKVLSITKAKAFFSFPVDHGILAWQRRLRYKWKCDLFMYNREQLNELFGDMGHAEIEVEQVSRDFLVTVRIEKNEIAQ